MINFNSYSIKNSFYTTGNASIDEAQIVFLGEFHTSIEDRTKNSWIINQYYQDGDLILDEGNDDTIQTASSKMLPYVNKPVNVRGWDHKAMLELVSKAHRNFVQALYCLTDLTTGIGGHAYNSQLALERLEKIRAIREKKHGFDLKAIDILETIKQTPNENYKRYQILNAVHHYASAEKKEVWSKITNTFAKRQRSMVNTIDRYLKQHRKIFVVAGKAHVAFNNLEKFNLPPNFQGGVNILKNYLETKKFIVLDPVPPPKSIQLIELIKKKSFWQTLIDFVQEFWNTLKTLKPFFNLNVSYSNTELYDIKLYIKCNIPTSLYKSYFNQLVRLPCEAALNRSQKIFNIWVELCQEYRQWYNFR